MREHAPAILRTAAVVALVVGVVLGLGSWDGLYDTLDLPQSLPAIGTQIGGVALVALAYALWASAPRAELRRIAATTGALAEGGAAGVIGSWLVFRDRLDLGGIGGLGEALLIATAVILAVLALAQARLALAGD